LRAPAFRIAYAYAYARRKGGETSTGTSAPIAAAPNAGPLREAGRSTQRLRRRWVSRAGFTHGKVPAERGVRPALQV